MARLDRKYVGELAEYLRSGELAEDFQWSDEERRGEMLEFLDTLMDLGDLANGTATKIIFKGRLGALMGMPSSGGGEASPKEELPR